MSKKSCKKNNRTGSITLPDFRQALGESLRIWQNNVINYKSSRNIKEKDVLFFFFKILLGPYPRYMEVPRLGVESEL